MNRIVNRLFISDGQGHIIPLVQSGNTLLKDSFNRVILKWELLNFGNNGFTASALMEAVKSQVTEENINLVAFKYHGRDITYGKLPIWVKNAISSASRPETIVTVSHQKNAFNISLVLTESPIEEIIMAQQIHSSIQLYEWIQRAEYIMTDVGKTLTMKVQPLWHDWTTKLIAPSIDLVA